MGDVLTTYIDRNGFFNTISIGGWLVSGSFQDPSQMSGIHHFIEHMIFNQENVRRKANQLKEKGAVYNAFTSHELTCFYVNCIPSDYHIGMEFINEILKGTHDFWKDTTFENERNIVLNEIEYGMNKVELVKYGLLAKIFREARYAKPITGDVNSVRSFTSAFIQTEYEKIYNGSHKFITVSGRTKEMEQNKPVHKEEFRFDPIEIKGPEEYASLDFDGPDGYCYYGVALYIPKRFRMEGQNYAFYLKNEMLKILREKLGAVYRIDSSNMNFYSGMVSFWIVKVKKELLPTVREQLNLIFSYHEEDLVNRLKNQQLQFSNYNCIRSDNVVSRMLNQGYLLTILKDENQQMEFNNFLSYIAEGKYYEFCT